MKKFHGLCALFGLLMGCALPAERPAGAPSAGVVDPLVGGLACRPEVRWETDTGAVVPFAELNGRVRLIAMFYSTCEGVCRTTREQMLGVEAALPAAVRARVGFHLATLDPPHDTPAVLREYRRATGLAPGRWTLLRGDSAATRELARGLGYAGRREGNGRYLHSSVLVILDAAGRVRARYDGTGADLRVIAHDLEATVAAGDAAHP